MSKNFLPPPPSTAPRTNFCLLGDNIIIENGLESRPKLLNRNQTQAIYVVWNLLVATLKKKKQMKYILIMSFSQCIYCPFKVLPLYVINIKIIHEKPHTFCIILSLWSLCRVTVQPSHVSNAPRPCEARGSRGGLRSHHPAAAILFLFPRTLKIKLWEIFSIQGTLGRVTTPPNSGFHFPGSQGLLQTRHMLRCFQGASKRSKNWLLLG